MASGQREWCVIKVDDTVEREWSSLVCEAVHNSEEDGDLRRLSPYTRLTAVWLRRVLLVVTESLFSLIVKFRPKLEQYIIVSVFHV